MGLIKARKSSAALKVLSKADKNADKAIENFFAEDERVSEPRVARLVSQLIPEGQGLFLSNSMPIRDMGQLCGFQGKVCFCQWQSRGQRYRRADCFGGRVCAGV